MKRKLLLDSVNSLLMLLFLVQFTSAQLVSSITTCPQVSMENFNTFAGTAATLPSGWTSSSTDYSPGGYYPTAAGTYSNSNSTFALGTSTDAAYGAKIPASGGPETMTFCYTNNTGQTLSSIQVKWDVEQYSQGGRATTVDFSYNLNGGAYMQTNITGTTLTTAITGANSNLAVVAVTARNITINQTILPGGTFCTRMTIVTGAGSGDNAHIGFDNFMVTSNCLVACPDLSNVVPNNVSITNSTCLAPACAHSGGLIIAPTDNCPTGSTLQYSLDGIMWSSTLPVYDQSGPAQTVITRCLCSSDSALFSNSSAPISTIPGICPAACLCTADFGQFPRP